MASVGATISLTRLLLFSVNLFYLGHLEHAQVSDVRLAATCKWPRVDGHSLSLSSFKQHYFEKRIVILTGLIDSWSCFLDGRWEKDNFLKLYGNYTFNSSDVAHNCRLLSSFEDGIQMREFINSNGNASWFVKPYHSLLRDMLQRSEFSPPTILSEVVHHGPHLSIGKAMQGNIRHVHETFWFAQVMGRKRWILGTSEPAQHLQSIRNTEGPCAPKPSWKSYDECIINPGEILYVPSNVKHENCCLDDLTIGISYLGQETHDGLPEKTSAALQATNDGRLSALKSMASEGIPVQSLSVSNGQTLLHVATRRGHVQVMEWLLSQRANVHRNNAQGNNPLAVAFEFQDASVVRALLEHGGRLRTLNSKALHLAAAEGHLQLLQYIISQAHKSKVPKLLAARDHEGKQPLHHAANFGHVSCVNLLLSYKAVLEDDQFTTPLDFALGHGHWRVIQALIDVMADVNRPNANNQRPIHVSGSSNIFGTAQSIRILAQARADLDAQDMGFAGMFELSALHLAAYFGNTNGARALVENRASIHLSARGPHGLVSPQVMAASEGHTAMLGF